MEFVKSFLIIVDEVERFPRREIIFSIDVVLKKRWVVALIELGVQDTVNILSTFIVLGEDWFARFLTLTRLLRLSFGGVPCDWYSWRGVSRTGVRRLVANWASYKIVLNS